MKRFLKHISLFLLPILIGIIVLYLMPYNKEFGYSYRKNVDCNTSWIYYRLFQNQTPIDIAFLGTSHTGCGINDSLLETLLLKQMNVVNLAYCTKGRNIQYPLIKDLVLTKKPRIVFLEVTEDEFASSHKDFSYIADLKDVFSPQLAYNPTILNDFYQAFNARFNYTKKQLKNELELEPLSSSLKNHSYIPFNFSASEQDMEKHKKKNSTKYKKYSSLTHNIKISSPKKYIKKIYEITQKEHITIIFLYLPSYGTALEKPLEYDFYKQYGDVWIPPNSIFLNPKNWVDSEHLNANGSHEIANWLSNQLSEN